MVRMILLMAVIMRMIVSVVVIVVVVVVVVVVVTMSMFMIVVVVRVIVIVAVMVMMRGAGALRGRAVGLERREQRHHLGGDAGEQRLDLGIAAQPHPVGEDLHRRVPVAEPPGEPRERDHIGNTRLDQRFGIRHDVDQAAVVEHQHVVGRERRRLGEIELDAGAVAGGCAGHNAEA